MNYRSKEIHKDIKTFHAKTRKDWRNWLSKYGDTETNVWVIIYKKASKTKSVNYEEAVLEALCFGWIDSRGNPRDEESSYLYFARRKPGGNWSKTNHARVEKLIAEGLMTPAGQYFINLAKASGTWELLVGAQSNEIPDDLMKQFGKSKTALKNFEAFPPSSKRIILEWIAMAKRPETRKKRIDETVAKAKLNLRAHHP